jgi:competence protein ComEA
MKTSTKSSLRSQLLSLLTATALLAQLTAPVAHAAGGRVDSVLDMKGPQQTAEYIFRNSPRDNLITVQIFGSVVRPGMYYVPEDTDLMKLLTLAGGVEPSSELDEVVVRKIDGKPWASMNSSYVKQKNPSTYVVDVDDLLRRSTNLKPLRMTHDDFVYVPKKEPFISNDFAKIVGIVSVVLTGVLTYVIIKEKSK